ncbi:MAG: hypothetical protein IJ684_02935 [Bacteroidales bacterium]|nr:hypothetical protein [Bacteroidales bacterium]
MRAGTPSPRYTTALDRLYGIDTPSALQECLIAFQTAVKGSFRTLSKKDEDALIAAVTTGDKPISPELYSRYADNFRRAVKAIPINDTDLSAQWLANVSRFAAYKAYHATEELRRRAIEEEGDMAILRATLHKYNRYQAAEYNTAVARARTGKQWLQFSEKDNMHLFPCIKWLPSRSANPREEHMPFYGLIWPKNDPFWLSNQPGTLWNCKCDWEQTDEDPTPNNPTDTIVMPGLDQNPAISGLIFTDTAPYIRKAPVSVEALALNITRKDNLQWAQTNLKGKTVRNEEFDHPIAFTGSGLKDYINQPIDNPILKNEMIRQMPSIIKKAKYLGYSDYKTSESIRHSHIFEVTMAGEKRWLIVHEYTNNDVSFYSISSSPSILEGIQKRNTRPLE